MFDSKTATYTVVGHSQKGTFFECDTLLEVNDSVHNYTGIKYVSAVRYNRTLGEDGGTTTVLTLHDPGLLGA
jgi:hypothetical protein